MAINFPMESRKGIKALGKMIESNSINVINDFDPIVSFKNIAIAVAKESTIDSDTFISKLARNFDIFVQILFKDEVRVDQIGFIVLFKNCDCLWVLFCFECHCFRLYIWGNISEVEFADAGGERELSCIFDHSKLIVVDGDCEIERSCGSYWEKQSGYEGKR